MRAMKDSGIEWIGEIPSEWGCIRFKFLNTGMNTGEAIDKELWTTDSADTVFYTAGVLPIHTSFNEFPKWKYTTKDDILLSRNGTPYVYYPVEKACYTDHIIRAKLNDKPHKRFLQYALQQSISSVVVDSVSLATWSASLWNEQTIPFPSIAQQTRIADFLDAKCAEIDRVVAETEKTIEEYKTLKQSVITEAVTKGVRGDRPMKDSGIEWIGEIPEEWSVVRIGSQYTERHQKVSDTEYAPLSVTMKGILPQLATAAKTDAHDDRKLVCKGDFAINSRSDRRGSCGISPCDGSVSLINTILCPRDEMNPKYHDWLFHSTMFSDEFYSWGHGIVDDLWTTNWQDMKKISIPKPLLSEQQEIADYLDTKCAEIDKLIAAKQQLLTELETYKKSVIYEYVTGKKEVK